MGPKVHQLFAPSREAILAHLMHVFGDQQKGMVEISWTPADTRDVSKARLFDVGALDEAADFACEVNAIAGQCVYVGAALRKPGTFPTTRTDDSDYYGTVAAYADLDEADAVQHAKAMYQLCKPTVAVITGRTPHVRVQLWWKLEDAFGDPARHKSMMMGIAAVLHGDPTVTNASRVMRLGGTVAWPKKDGRITEMTALAVPSDGRPRAIYSDRLEAIFPPLATIDSSAPSQAGRGPVSGKLSADWLLAEIQAGRQWHNRVNQLVGHWIMRNWSDAEILATALFLTLPGYSIDQTVREIRQSIAGARRKWQKPDTAQEFDEAEAPAARKIQFLSMAQINDLQPPTYAIDKLITENGFALVWGKQASFKSFFALDMALHMSYGLPFHGRETLPKRVLYIAGEGASGFKNRIGAWRKHYGQVQSDCFHMLATGINLIGKAGADELIAAIKESGLAFEYIFVDTVARAMLGAEENDASSMGLFIQACDMVRAAFGCGLAAVHHAGKDAGQGPRGSTALPAAVDTDFEAVRTESTSLVTITCKKQKDDEEPEPFRFKAEKVDVSSLGIAGQSSLIMLSTDAAAEVKERKLTYQNVNEFLEITRRDWEAGNPWSNSAQTKKNGRYLPEWISRRFEISIKAAEGYVSELLFNGFMTIEMYDKKTRKNGLKVLKMHPGGTGVTQEPD